MNEVSLTKSEQQALKIQLAKIQFLDADSVFSLGEEELNLYRKTCGELGSDKSTNTLAKLNSFVIGGSNDPVYVFCPGVIYYALAAHPNLAPAEALRKFSAFIIAHELGYSIDVLRFKASHTFSEGCYDGPKKDYNDIQTSELVGDYWAVNYLAQIAKNEINKNSPDKVIQQWLQNSALVYMCNVQEKIELGHSSWKFRIQSLGRNSILRRSLGCDPAYLGKKSCDIYMK